MATENFKNKIQQLQLENFTCFSKATFDFSSGINVFIGENGTGKTHILKVLYSNLVFSKNARQGSFVGIEKYFGVSDSDSLINLTLGSQFHIKMLSGNSLLMLSSEKVVPPTNETVDAPNDVLFIPTHEMLTLYSGFIASYENRENSFDKTYYDLAKKLNALPFRGKALEEVEPLLQDIENAIGAKIYRKGEHFYLKFTKTNLEIEAALAAEGIKKLGQMIYLIVNGSLKKDTILFWDEPEVNLNPRYIKIVVKFLQTLAKHGVQIFVATHDYLLVHLLSLDAEYQTVTQAPPMKFFALTKDENGTEVESADTIAGINNNVLLDEYAAYTDLEHELFRKSMQAV